MSDPRFTRIAADPRFRRPRKHHSKIVVDERFKDALEPTKKSGKRKTDKYGRVLPEDHERDDLRRFYSLGEEGESPDDPTPTPDYARGEVLLQSSDEEDDRDETEPDVVVLRARDNLRPTNATAEIDLNEEDLADLDAQAAAYNQNVTDEDEPGEVTPTRRLAVVNLDWDHIRAAHLFKIFSSLVSRTAPVMPSSSDKRPEGRRSENSGSLNVARGTVLTVRIYPSEFGRERLIREEKEGPLIQSSKRKTQEDEEVNERNIYEVGDENERDDDALRQYQLMRLRYYYAIVTCDTVDAASHIYSELQGTELERSANVFDLSFVPDDMSFEDDPWDEATDIQSSNMPIEFATTALRHSKVKLTWDEDDPERNRLTRRTLTRQEIEEADFKAYLASSTSGSDSEDDPSLDEGKARNGDKKIAARDNLRALLLGRGEEELPEGWGGDEHGDRDDVDMEITFTPALNGVKEGNDENTLEIYQRKVKEKKKRRKEKFSQQSNAERAEEDEFFDGPDTENHDAWTSNKKGNGIDRNTSVISPHQPISAEELALLVVSDKPGSEPKHFNLKSVLKAEKASKLKGKRKRKELEQDDETQEDFAIDLKDDRFKSLHEDYAFAIDPSHPHFKKTKSMLALLEERAKMQKSREPGEMTVQGKNISAATSNRGLQRLAESVKQKSGAIKQRGKR